MRISGTQAVFLGTLAGVALSAPAAGANFGAFWREVDNSHNTVTGASTGLAGAWRTFDLYITGETGARIHAINMGYGADPSINPEFIYTDGEVFDHPDQLSFFAPRRELLPYFDPALEFDTYFAVGSTPATAMTAIGSSIALDGPELRGIWFVTPGTAHFPVYMDESGEMKIFRVTVSSDTTQLGGFGSVIQIGTRLGNQPSEPDVFVPLSIGALLLVPSPGAAGVLAMGAILVARRRR